MFAVDFGRKTGRAWQSLYSLLCAPSRLRNGIPGLKAKGNCAVQVPEGAELLEFALVLPLLVVMLVGILDFAHAYNIKQKLANAARAGARVGAATTTFGDSGTCTNYTAPCSVESIYNNVMGYLSDAGIDTSSLVGTSPAQCSDSSGNLIALCWDYTAAGNSGLKTLTIERGVSISGATTALSGTRVTITYNYDWTFGFNRVINLLTLLTRNTLQVPASVLITVSALMANQ